MKKIIVLMFIALVALTACQTKKEGLTTQKFIADFNESKIETRRFVLGDTEKEAGKTHKFEFNHFAKANAVDSSKKEEVEKYFADFSKQLTDTVAAVELQENTDTKRHSGKMLFRFDAEIDKAAYVVFADGVVMLISKDEIKNFNFQQEDLAKFEALKTEFLAKIEEFKK